MDALIEFTVLHLLEFWVYILGLSELSVLIILIGQLSFGLICILFALLLIRIALYNPLHSLSGHCSLILNHLNQLFALKFVTSVFVQPII